ncbi:hypothetical protein [Photobacterium jeanii]|uniref:hypothetical protein n=1 Tax=Photobacterium jeanii TaxID=858640 RepID=UPI000A06E7D8|nr:hypothetical protein [Photobacterium jeanii]PST91273.1 hypothetical protein C9I91_11090 [Photobacterium jeanii]
MVEVEKLKAVIRNTRPVGLERYENSAEYSWKKHNISKESVLSLNGDRIAKASSQLWQVLEVKLHQAIENGALK